MSEEVLYCISLHNPLQLYINTTVTSLDYWFLTPFTYWQVHLESKRSNRIEEQLTSNDEIFNFVLQCICVYMHGFRFFFSQRKATLAELNNGALKQVLVKAWGIVWRGYPLCIVLHGLFQQLVLLAIVWKRKQLCNLSAILRGEFSGWQTSNLQLHQEFFFVGLKQSR